MTLQSVVAFFAHPDDETIMAGGLLAMLAEQGVAVQVICATHGEGGEMGEPPVVPQRELLGAAREAEVRCAAQALGVGLTLLDYVDPAIGPEDELSAFEADFDRLALEFAEIARRRQADVILTHGADGEYGHPAHKLVNQAVLHGMKRHFPDVLVYTIAANVPGIKDRLWNDSEPAHLALDITPWSEAKVAAMECHLSQHALFKRRRKLKTVRDSLRSVESVRRQWPEVDTAQPDDAFAALLVEVGAWIPRTKTDGD